ncbi:hypothetical protein BJY00DRAFT_312629 [Aspergillus carlsbadensis]|nr:hypothetical protein BJY00DRAFT_312629 [Aspergillus carlsbadensis]
MQAEDGVNIETRSPRQSRHDLSDSRPTLSRRVAVDGSIYSIIRRNPRIALYVDPIAWTSDHLQSLGCSFNRQRLPKKGHRHTQDDTPEESGRRTTASLSPELAARLKYQLALLSTLSSKRYTIKDLLEADNILPQGSEDLPFQFNHQIVAQLPTDGIFMSSAALPTVAFITFDTIKSLRESFIRPRKTTSIPILNKTRSRLRLLEPRDRAEDPYLVGVLIALAQAQRRQQQQQPSGEVNLNDVQSFKVKVLAIPGTRAKYLYVYTATIPTDFLDKFDEPSRSSPSSPVSVSYYRIAVKDERSLERLHRLLDADSCT